MSVRLSSEGRGSDRLAGRRRLRRRRVIIAWSILSVLLFGAVMYGLWQTPVRIQHVVMYGTDQSLALVATTAMQGWYLGVPRDSVFFIPESNIRSLIMSAHPDIAAVSIFRNGFTGLSIKVDYRVPIARWCGAPPAQVTASSTPAILDKSRCYFFDASGYLFATTTTAQPVNSFTVYESLVVDEGQTFINKTLPNAEKLPAAFDFARQLVQFGSPITAVAFRDDEVDVALESGTRITYLLGEEQNAFTALASARANFNLSDGTINYVDLRFPGKVYLKRK